MKLWKREPEDLVASQVAELDKRASGELDEFGNLALEAMATGMGLTLSKPERERVPVGPTGQIVASGGWCAPSETIWSLSDITVRRGGVRYGEPGTARSVVPPEVWV